ncbi:MAG: hypothetical protein JWQ75_3481 [Pseudarthrobacter sp.]|nr:hypothetical protein [Pseudarthrobacter sp.]
MNIQGNQRRRRSSSALIFRAVLTLALLLGLVSCGTIKLGQAAADDVFRAVGKAGKEVTLAQDDLERLSIRYSVNPDVMKSVAPEAASVPAWTRTRARIAAIYQAAQDSEAASAAAGIGCEALTGQIQTPADLTKSLNGALAGMNPNWAASTRTATQELQKELAKIKKDGTENDKAAALWACYSVGLVI